ncbi:MAG TPA: hypothetical protein VK195_03535 [Burkholderiaceae bacterium]|nr:hypothetical protein [Burkholderiaceae bacterium]
MSGLIASSPRESVADMPPLEILLNTELQRLRECCAGLNGATLSTQDGLSLSVMGELPCEATAATAAFLLNEVDVHLNLLRAGCVREALVWTDAGPWYLTRIGELPYVLLLCATAAPAAALRHAGTLAAAHLHPLLKHWHPQD